MTTEVTKPRLAPEFIDFHAFGMVKHLQKAGHTTYLVGGCVRDLMVGQTPKDFDIGTSALPQQVKRLINFAFIIGKRFRLVLAKRDDRQYEIATFRREPRADEFPEGVPFGDNIFGTPEEDSRRRDFTCNGVFYDPVSEKVIDYVDGTRDIEGHLVRMIGDPNRRLQEDPIRILRALRLAHKLHFRIEPALRTEMSKLSECMANAVLPRRREEYMKLLRLNNPVAAFREGSDLNLWGTVLSELDKVYKSDETADFFEERLHRLETRLIDGTDTAFLGGAFVLAWLRAAVVSPDHEFISIDILHNNAGLQRLMRDQLGLHNWEQARIVKALSVQKVLADVETFKRKGQRRRIAFVQSEAFPLALDLAHIDALLDPETLDYWDGQLEEALLNPQVIEPEAPTHRPQRGRSGRRRRH